MKQVLVLVGPKGAGKSTLGDLLSRELPVLFLRVEPLFLELRARLGAAHPDLERLGFAAVLDAVSGALPGHDHVCIETTGASDRVPWLLQELASRARVLPVRVLADPEQCLERIHRRDRSIHIPVSDDDVARINAIAQDVDLPWAAEIDNRGPLDAAAIVATIRSLLG